MTGADDPRATVERLIAQFRSTLENARSMPMSSSAVVNRSELLDLLSQIEQAIPGVAASIGSGGGANATYAEAKAAAERVMADAHAERQRLIDSTHIHRVAVGEADRIRKESQAEAEALRRETDEYVDIKLANFQITLSKTLEAVSRGRERLQGRSDLDELGNADVDDIVLPDHR